MGFYGPQNGRSWSLWTSEREDVELVGSGWQEYEPDQLRMEGVGL